MAESILTSVKKVLGIDESDESFDLDVTMHINAAFSVLQQLGVGPSEGFAISDANDDWSQFIDEDKRLNIVPSYVYMKVRSLFDPPTTGYLVEALKNQINEAEYRLANLVDIDPVVVVII